jgi:hypothetical protein
MASGPGVLLFMSGKPDAVFPSPHELPPALKRALIFKLRHLHICILLLFAFHFFIVGFNEDSPQVFVWWHIIIPAFPHTFVRICVKQFG